MVDIADSERYHDEGMPLSPAKLSFVSGDATAPLAPGNKLIAHICNDSGGWGAGFVVAISRRWSEPEADYRAWYAGRSANDFALGSLRLVQVSSDLWVANMVAQRGTRARDGVPPIRYDAVEACLRALAQKAAPLGASVHMPRIGCGLAGGRWEEIEPLIERCLIGAGVDVTVYDYSP
jgi:O-acetyl-ADP-ribose deacetylase (regulator of RNase III)